MSGATLFGVPQVDELDNLTDLPEFAGPDAIDPNEAFTDPLGPPPAELGDAPGLDALGPDLPQGGRTVQLSSVGPGIAEFDADAFGEGGALELDLPGAPEPAAPPIAPPSVSAPPAPQPPSRGRSRAPAPPKPPVLPPSAFRPPPADVPDLPGPRTGPPPSGPASHGLPPPPDPGAFDLPAPVDLDLPAPSGLDLPQPREPLPPPGELDLPQPLDLDLPEPAGQEVHPAGQDLVPAGQGLAPLGQDLAPAEQGLESAEQRMQPADMSVAPNDLGMLEPSRPGSAPSMPGVGSGAAAGSAAGLGAGVDELVSHQRSPTPRAIPRQPVSRGALYGAAALLVVGGLGVGLFYAGIFDGLTGDEPAAQGRGVTGPKSEGSQGEIQERSGEMLAKLKVDTPQSYQAAMELAQSSGDVVGQAEAALLLDLRYGPDQVLRAQGTKLLEPYAAVTDPHVQRVVGLSKLVSGELSGAEQALQGDDLRTRLYRGYLRFEQDKLDEAMAEAKAVLDVDGSELAAQQLLHAAALDQDPVAAREAIAQALKANPEHPGLQELAIESDIAAGYLAQAAATAERLQPPADASAHYRARVLTLKGRLAAARGDYPRAIARLGEALNVAPNLENAQITLGRILLDAGELRQASQTASSAVEAHPGSVDAALLRVETLVATGEGDEALELAQSLGKKLPDRPEPPYLEGKVQAMRLQLEEGKHAFARALSKDPAFYDAMSAEAQMLAAGREPEAALGKIEAAIEKAQSDKASPSVIADLMVERAALLSKQDQSQAAITALDQALEVLPTHNRAQARRGVLKLELGETESGQADLMAVYERTGGYPGMTAPLGRLFARQGKTDELAQLLGDQLEDSRTATEIKLVGARLRLLKGNAEGAKQLADEALSREPNNWEAHLLMAEAFRMAGDFSEALQQIERVEPPTPQAELHFFRGRIYEFNGKYDEARAEYQRALAIADDLHEARFLYGRLMSYQGLSKQALDELDKVIAATGDQYPMAYMARGIARKDLGQHDQAIRDYDKALGLDESLAEAHYWKGKSLFTLNKDKAAAAAFEAATQAELPSDSTPDWYLGALVGLGETRLQLGQPAQAKPALQKYLELAPDGHPQRTTAERKLAEIK